LKVFLYVQHLLGTGHMVRAAAIGEALAARGADVLIAAGNTVPPTLQINTCKVIALPLIRAADATFQLLLDANDQPIDDAWRTARADALLNAYRRFAPDVLVTETFPFGRRQFTFELLPLLQLARDGARRPLIASSIRDILVRKEKLSKERWMADTAAANYDLVLVHSDPNFVRLEDSFPFADKVAHLTRYTGFVAPQRTRNAAPASADGKDEIIVSSGGGAVGIALLNTTIAAAGLSPGRPRWRILVGHGHSRELFGELTAMAPDNVVVERARPDFPALLSNCAVSISQAGYNTVLDILRAGCPAIFVPFAEHGESEQTQRAQILARRGIGQVLREDTLDAAQLARTVSHALVRKRAALEVQMNGDEVAAEMLLTAALARAGQ
jgi:predicted glycosyltransferase